MMRAMVWIIFSLSIDSSLFAQNISEVNTAQLKQVSQTELGLTINPIRKRTIDSSLHITGRSQPGHNIVASRDTVLIGVATSNQSGDFAIEVPLLVGSNSVQVADVSSLDASNGVLEFQVISAPIPERHDLKKVEINKQSHLVPQLYISKAANEQNPRLIEGSAERGANINLFVNGRSAASVHADEEGNFSTWLALQDGQNRVYATTTGAINETLLSETVQLEYQYDTQRSTSISGTLAQSETWTQAGSPYLIAGNLTVPNGLTLTIQEGVEVRFAYRVGLIVDGTLQVNGTSTNPVVFTADDATSAVSDWTGITASSSSSLVNMDHARLEWAFQALYFANGGSGTISNTTLRDSRYGVFVAANSSPIIDGNNTLTANQYGISVTSSSTTVANTLPIVRANAIHGNSFYDYQATSTGTLSGTVKLDATGNWWGATDIQQIRNNIYDYSNATSSPVVDFNNFLDAQNGMPVNLGVVLNGVFTGQQSLGADHYTVLGDLSVPSGSELTLSAGASLEFASNDLVLNVNGQLNINGTELDPVILTAPQATASRSWEGIKLLPGAIGQIQHLLLQAATNGIYVDEATANISNTTVEYAFSAGIYFLNGGTGSVQESLIRNNRYGVFVGNNSSPIIDANNNITANQYGLFVSSNFLSVANTSPIVRNNHIHANTLYNYYAISSGSEAANYTLDATANWWGSNDVSQIKTSIYDNADAGTSPNVDFLGFVDQSGVEVLSLFDTKMSAHELHPYLAGPIVIDFLLNTDASVALEIVRESDDVLVFQTLNTMTKGARQFSWDGTDDNSQIVTDGLYRARLTANRGIETFNVDPTIVPGLGSVGLLEAFPAVMNPHRNEPFVLNLTAVEPVQLSMQVNPGNGMTIFNHLSNHFVAPGEIQVFWDGRFPSGEIVQGQPYIFFPAPLRVRPLAINIIGAKPILSDPNVAPNIAPNISIKSDPFLITHSYEQISKVVYQLDQDAFVTFKLLPPGIYDPAHASAVVLVNNQRQNALDGMGQALSHSVEWRGHDLLDTNQILTTEEGVYTFTIEAQSVASGQSTLYRGALQIRQ